MSERDQASILRDAYPNIETMTLEQVRGVWRDAMDRMMAMEAENARLTTVVDRQRAALAEISVGAGPYSRDPLTHASNCIESMKAIAAEAAASSEGGE